jgi:uncharacterized membrane protein YqjE
MKRTKLDIILLVVTLLLMLGATVAYYRDDRSTMVGLFLVSAVINLLGGIWKLYHRRRVPQ